MSPAPGPITVSAPDLTGPVSILNWPVSGPGGRRAQKPRALAHVHLEIDLRHERYDEPALPILRQFEQLFRERSVVEQADLLRLAAGALHAFSACGFNRVDHWEMTPGGWLALPEPTHRTLAEPVGHLLRALSSDAWRPYARGREFAVRLSGPTRIQADLVVRRVHRERGHSITVDLRGTFSGRDLDRLARALRERVPVLRSRVVAVQYAPEGAGTRRAKVR
jgi:hypothetical protein